MFSIKIEAKGLKELRQNFQELANSVDAQIKEDLEKYLNKVLLNQIRLNTPILSGNLRESLTIQLRSLQKGRVGFNVISDLPYALRVHEEERRLGPVSAIQPEQPEGGVGNKFVERVVHYHAEEIRAVIGKAPLVTVRKLYPSGAVRPLR